MLIELKGIHLVKAKLANGEQAIYYYAWRGGPRIVDPTTKKPMTDPNSAAFRAAYDALKHPPEKAADKLTLDDLVTKFKASTDFTRLSASSRRNYGMMLDKIRAEFGGMTIGALQNPKARGAFKEWRDTLARTPRTADYAWMVLARVLSCAKDRGDIAINQAERGGRLYESDRIDKIWTEDDLAKLFAVCSAEVFDVVMLALWTGQRQGDLLKLAWTNFDGQYIRLRQGKSRRRVTIPAGPSLTAALEAIPRIDSTQMLNSSDGRPWTSDGFRTSFFRAVERADVRGLTFHDLRGTAVTRLALAGCTPEEIATITGHSFRDVNSILDTHYLSRDVKLAEQAIEKLERKRAGTETVKRPVKWPRRSPGPPA